MIALAPSIPIRAVVSCWKDNNEKPEKPYNTRVLFFFENQEDFEKVYSFLRGTSFANRLFYGGLDSSNILRQTTKEALGIIQGLPIERESGWPKFLGVDIDNNIYHREEAPYLASRLFHILIQNRLLEKSLLEECGIYYTATRSVGNVQQTAAPRM